MITGFVAPTAGRVEVLGVDVHADPIVAKQAIGYLPEGVPLYPEMRVVEFLRYRAALKRVERSAVPERIEQALERAMITDVRNRIIGQLSKGYRQRVGLADALVSDPPILILDEPTSGLDPNQVRQVRELIRRVSGDKTVFISTHLLPEVEAICERVVIIHQGCIVAQGKTEEVGRAGHQQNATLIARGDGLHVQALLSVVKGVRDVQLVSEMDGGVCELHARVESGGEVLERMVQALVRDHVALREISATSMSLESVFAELTVHEEPLR